MFGNCCGCNKKEKNSKSKNDKSNANNTDNVGNRLDNDVPDTHSDNLKCSNKDDNDKHNQDVGNCKVETAVKKDNVKVECIRRNMEIKIEEPDNDDVFTEGVGPPIPLATNLATPDGKKGSVAGLPKWFSEEDDHETGGTQEPPATPVGRDELALRRHRFFSDLLSAAHAATEHRVRFDPMGPVVAGGPEYESECIHQIQTSEFESLVSRLERVTVRLEQTVGLASPSSSASTMSLQAFADIVNGTFAQYLNLSHQIGGDVAAHSKLVQQAFQAEMDYLGLASQSRAPSQNEQVNLLKPLSTQIEAVQNFRERNRTSVYFNHLSAISESIPALGWVTLNAAPAPFVKEMNDAGQFYTNRVLKDWKEKDKKHFDWVKSWVQTLSELQQFVKQHHTTGLVWAGGAGAPPPPPPNIPPPPIGDFSALAVDDSNNDRSALFAEINQGEGITKNLKKVTSDMQTHKNTTLRTGPAPFKAPAPPARSSVPSAPLDKPPSFTKDGKKWIIEYQKGNHNLVVENTEMNNVVYVFKCVDSTIQIKGKINSIVLDLCKKTSVVFDSLVSSIEFVNCQSVQMQVFGKVPTISVDKTDGCQMYLSNESLDVEIISSKSSEMNVLVPKPNGDYAEYPIPEQYKTTILPGKGLSTVIVESKG